MQQLNPKVAFFFEKDSKWKEAYEVLRMMLLDTALTEELKWGCPCYTLNGKNVVLIHGFKDYCALLFHKGALLKDPDGKLIQQTANVQAARQLRFQSVMDIMEQKELIQSTIQHAIEVEKAGLEVEMKETRQFDMPEEFQRKLDSIAELKEAFENLTPGRQRGYLLYFSSAKQAKTREARVEKYMPKILEGKGLEE